MLLSHEIEVYVRFSETDAAGHVNNTSYFLYLEEARTKFFQTIGIGGEHPQSNLNFIIASTKCDYLAQAYAGQTLKVSTNIEKVGTKSFSVNHAITNVDADLAVAQATATIVCFNFVEQKTESIPVPLRNELENRIVKQGTV